MADRKDGRKTRTKSAKIEPMMASLTRSLFRCRVASRDLEVWKPLDGWKLATFDCAEVNWAEVPVG